MSSVSRGDAFMMAWASVDVGVYGFSAIRSRAFGSANGSVFRALVTLRYCQLSKYATHGITACNNPHVLCSIRRRSSSSCEVRRSGLSSYSAILTKNCLEIETTHDNRLTVRGIFALYAAQTRSLGQVDLPNRLSWTDPTIELQHSEPLSFSVPIP